MRKLKNVFSRIDVLIFKKIKIPTFSVGDSILIKNPNHQDLVTTLNVVGSITKRVCKDVYLVSYGQNNSIVLYMLEKLSHMQ